jgi:hypothetical protein
MLDMDVTQGPARSRSDYYYEPLPNPRTYIRLLQIQTCNFNATIQCTLTQWLHEEAPPYCAISYTWGDPNLTSTIGINLKSMIVRQNCEGALRQAHAAGPWAYFWVDAICINQEDNAEKSHQVAIMASFYRQAIRVLVCVGQHDSHSLFVFAVLRWYNDYFTRMYERFTAIHNSQAATEWTFSTWKTAEDLSVKQSSTMLGRRAQLEEAVHFFFKRPYFSRVWVLQELYMGNGRITICCGIDQQPFGPLFALTRWINNCGSHDLDRYVEILYRGWFWERDPTYHAVDYALLSTRSESSNVRILETCSTAYWP